ncbi:MAG: hypothetical protein ACRD4P_11340, partial [Bryobacteraceae bacterium]
MTFELPVFVLFVVLPLTWIIVSWRRTARPLAMCLKGITLTLILLALSGPVVRFPETKMAVAVLADTSSSISDEGL